MALIQRFQNAVQGSRATDVIQGTFDWVSGVRSSVQGWAGALFTTAANGSNFVGMNYNEVPNIRESIRQYVKNIQSVADGLNTDADANQAVHGEISEETKKYLNAIKDITDAYVSTLLVYSDKMYEYYEAYGKNDTQLSQNVSEEAKSLESNAQSSTYTEKY